MFEAFNNGILSSLFSEISHFIPRFLLSMIVLFIGWLLAKLISFSLAKGLEKIKIDHLSQKLNDVDFMQENKLQVKISGLISSALYYFIMVIFLVAATDLLGVAVISTSMGNMISYFPQLLSAVAIVLIGIFVSDAISKLVRTTCTSLGMPSGRIIGAVVFYLLFVTILVSALAQAKIDTAFLASNITVIIGAGALAFAIGYGLASRDLASNYLAGYYNKNKVRVGDEIILEGVRGKVVLIDSNSLVIQTQESAVIIPMSKLTTQKVEIIYPDANPDTKQLQK